MMHSEDMTLTTPLELEGYGIVHLGLGAFHKSHQAFYTQHAMAVRGGDWHILGISMRNSRAADELNAQGGRYALLVQGNDGTRLETIESIRSALCLAREPERVLEAMCHPTIRIVSATVTEKGYGMDLAARKADISNPTIAHDLAEPDAPQSTLGLIVRALRLRRDRGLPPFAVLSCDNLASNGALVRAGVLDFADRTGPELSEWIATNVAFPSTMVDRITPAPTEDTRITARRMTGEPGEASVAAEEFHQWVIEDNFPQGRPAWEEAGAIFATDVAPYEEMKLRMLNGSHSLLAYLGVLLGHRYVRDAIADPIVRTLVQRHLKAAAATLNGRVDIDLAIYAQQLLDRFANPNIAHETIQIAADGSQKLPQRIFSAAQDALNAGQSARPFALATAIWLHYCAGKSADGRSYDIADPLGKELQDAACLSTAAQTLENIAREVGLFPEQLAGNRVWISQITELLAAFRAGSFPEAIQRECEQEEVNGGAPAAVR